MFKNILVAVDDSTHAKAAVEYGAYLSAKFRTRLELLHVIDWRFLAGHFITHFDEVYRSGGGESFRERVEHYYQSYGERLLEEARARSVELGARDVTVSVEMGNVAKHIIKRAAQSDLLVIGQQGETAEDGPGLLGAVTERVIRSIDVAALVVQPPMREFRRALLAYDGSAAAHRAMETLVRLAAALKLEIEAVHLIEPRKDKTSLKRAAEYLDRHSVPFETTYLRGKSHARILEHAREKGCDLLVMGAFADKAVEVLALGTTTEAMLRMSHIPVLVHR
jgi:nucleotide-binding universal stress UspA family protein